MTYYYKDKKLNFLRYPRTTNKSLRAWNTSDEYLLNKLEDIEIQNKKIAIYNDRFGFLTTMLNKQKPIAFNFYKSQEIAVLKNLENNNINRSDIQFHTPFEYPDSNIDIALIKIPKSMGLFRYFLQHLSKNITPSSIVLCGFMTRHFSKQMLAIALDYFEEVSQSLAWKKSRLLVLKTPKSYKKRDLIEPVVINSDIVFKQYPGVFSANTIDSATKFLIDTISLKVKDKVVLDLGCGNGILGYSVYQSNSKAELHLIDDSFLAIESAKINLSKYKPHFYYNDTLKNFDNNYFDLVISNPPFHFEHENNIEISIGLFKHVARILKEKGRFVLIANKHLNYKTHLIKIFNQILILAENEKFIIYECMNLQEEVIIEDDDSRFNI